MSINFPTLNLTFYILFVAFKRILWLSLIILPLLFSINSALAQGNNEKKDKPKKEKKKKGKLPPEDLGGALLNNAQYNFSYSILKPPKDGVENIISPTLSKMESATGGLKNISLNNPTSLHFGPDDRLYVSQQNGIIFALTIVRNGPNDYAVTKSEVIDLVKNIPNHDDDGKLNTKITSRQVTGLLVTGTASKPILYVSSSDSRIGGGSTAGDKNLDTNSGIISRLTWTGKGWEKVDLVRGLPRSEENHAVNGMQLDEGTNTLYIAVGGFTNAGSPSNNFAFISEYALSAAILSVDLNAIAAMPTKGTGNTSYKYDLPTLDDPTRSNNPDGLDINDPFGGNDGLNQAKLVSGGPVQVYASGFRNAYDLVITKTPGKANRIYTIDNGANQGWGGHPEHEGSDGKVTNNYVPGEPGSTGPGPNDPRVNNLDNFHYIGRTDTYEAGSYYGGHPAPIRANPVGAGMYTHDGTNGVWRTGTTGSHPLPADWPPVPISMANSIEGDFQNAGETDRALLTFSASTNGLTEYTASNFNNELKGHLLAASYDGKIHRITLTEDGNEVTNSRKESNKLNGDLPFASGFGAQPLDITAQGDNDIFPGTVWAATYGADAITVFEPEEYVECSGLYSTELDEDNDGYSNADEIDNATNPCSASSKPDDSDGDLISDLNDPDDDNDGLGDDVDYFALDPDNGRSTHLPLQYDLFNNYPGTGFFGLGFTGLMSNQQADNDYHNLFEEENLIAGGAVGAFSIVAVSPFDALGELNNQENAFQFGVEVNSGTGPFTIHSSMLGPFFDNQPPQNFQSQGMYIGTGDQDNYLKVALNANNGMGGLVVVYENAGVPSTQQFPLAGGVPGSNLDLFFSVNPVAGTVQPKYSLDGGEVLSLGEPFQLEGLLLEAVQDVPALAIGIISTSRNASPFTATWDFINITHDAVTGIGQWERVHPESGAPTARHEAAFVQAGDKFYLIGGRGIKAVEEYDPLSKSWVKKAATPIELHHFQAVVLDGLIYVVGAFTGEYPHETPVPNIYIYNPLTDEWITGPAIPEARRRGSAGVAVHHNKIYLVGGILDGHWGEWVPWFDEYDPVTNAWITLSDAPRARDHFHAATIGDKIYLAGGRRSSAGTNELYTLTVPEVDVYSFATNSWSTLSSASNLPTPRAGATTAVLGEELFVIGGESSAHFSSHQETEAFNVRTNTWRSLANLHAGRQGMQAIVNNNVVYVVAGSGNRDGSPELSSLETFYLFPPSEPDNPALSHSSLEVPSQEDFGVVTVGTDQSKTIKLSNTGSNLGIVVSSISIPDGSLFSLETPYTLPFVIPAGESVELTVVFSPASTGLKSANLQISHSGSGGSSTTVLKGEGLGEGIVASASNLHFFSQQAGTSSAPQNITLTNKELSRIDITAVKLSGVNSNEFSTTFTETVILNPGNSFDLNITFSPASLGTKVAELSIEHTGPNSPLIIGLTGEGYDNQEGPQAVYRINAGGKEMVSPEVTFASDAYYSPTPGHTYSKNGTISGASIQAIYQTERSATTNNGTFSYALPIKNGQYTVVLHFAEIYWSAAGQRVFDVTLENSKVLDNYDIVQETGAGMKAISETFTVEVADEMLDIFFSSLASEGGVNRPKISAIEVLPYEEERNKLPIASAGDDQTITLPTNSVTLSGSGTDSDGTITAYQWKQESGPGAATFSSKTVANPTVSNLQQGSYLFSLTVTDNEGGVSAKDEVVVTVNPAPVENELPTVHSGEDKIITLPTNTATFTATASDADGTIASYLWEKVSGPTAILSGATTATLSLSGLEEGAYTFRVTVTDDKGATASDEVNLVVNAGTDDICQSLVIYGTKQLSLSSSIVLTGDFTIEYWAKLSGSITNADAPVSGGSNQYINYYKAQARLYSKGASGGHDPVVSSHKTVANTWTHYAFVREGSSMKVYINGIEDIGAKATNQWTGDFTINNLGQGAGFLAGELDELRIWSVARSGTNIFNNYQSSIAANASGLVAYFNFEESNGVVKDISGNGYNSQNLPTGINRTTSSAPLVSCEEVNQPNQLPIALAGDDQTITLPTSSVNLNGSGTDADGSITAYLWKQENGPKEAVISDATSAKPVVSGLVDGNYIFSLTVTDNEGGVSLADIVKVTVNPAEEEGNQVPVVHAGSDKTITLPDNQIHLSGLAWDSDGRFIEFRWEKVSGPSVSMSGHHTANVFLSDLVEGVYVFRFYATDNDGATGSDDMTLTVKPAPGSPGPLLSSSMAGPLEISVYPNTFDDHINLLAQAEEPQKYDVLVYDLLGKVLHQSSFESKPSEAVLHRLNMSDDFSHGVMYLLRVENKEQKTGEIFKVIKSW